MIRRIELRNFMSHRHTVIEPAEGLTVLVGPNNCGKSAVVAALQVICHNDPATYVTRHGEKECSVEVETDEGHVIRWSRKGGGPRYTINGQVFDRLGRSGVPEELCRALRLAKVVAEGGQAFDAHFGEQKAPVFLIDKPESHAAQFFASSSDAGKLVRMQALHRQKVAGAKREQADLQAEAAGLARQLEALSPAAAIDEQLQQAEAEHAALLALSERIAAAVAIEARLTRCGGELAARAAEAEALSPLRPPPALAPTAPLEQWIEQAERTRRVLERQAARARALEALPAPPELEDAAALEALVRQIGSCAGAADRLEAEARACRPLAAPPVLADTSVLETMLRRLRQARSAATKAEAQRGALQALPPAPEPADPAPLAAAIKAIEQQAETAAAHARAAASIDAQLHEAEEALRRLAREQEACPTCGAPLDQDRLISSAHAGAEAHAHA